MKHMKKILALVLVLALSLALFAGCGKKEEIAPVRVGVLKGPTGVGATWLIRDNEEGTTENEYEFSLAAAPDELAAALIGADPALDIAAIPTNLAVSLYNKTEGGITLIALNTLGVLYILEKGETVQSVADLAGRTIYATGKGSNPEYTLNYLLRQNGLEPGEDVTIEWMASDELATRMGNGELELCMLPVPAATSVLMKNSDVRKALSLSELWDELDNDSTLTMGCAVVRTAYLEEHPEQVDLFLREYADSIARVRAAEDEVVFEHMAEYGIVGAAAVGKAALADCNLTFVAGEDMMEAIEGYYEVLFDADPTSIGGALPDEAFYYTAYQPE